MSTPIEAGGVPEGESSKRPRSPSPTRLKDEPAEKKVAVERAASAQQAVESATAHATAAKSTAYPSPAVAVKEEQVDEEEAVANSSRNKGKWFQGRNAKMGKNSGGGGKVREGGKSWHDQDQRKSRPWKGETVPKDELPGGASKDGDDEGEDADGQRKLPKRKAAVLLGYCGTGYSGMQIQPNATKTIEGEMFNALVKAGAVSADNSDDPRKVDVHRAARTDAGVHAAGNCISLKMILDPPLPEGFPTLASYVNSFLPEQIRMWGFVRTLKSFVARTGCDSRKYEYLLPSYCLLPPPRTEALSLALDKSSPGWREPLGEAAAFADAGIVEVPEETEDGEKLDPRMRGEYERRRGWRVDKDTLGRFRALVAQYKGTHNYHNYTLGKPFNDRSVKRYMISLDVQEPVVVGEIEWISVQIHGQSFMLHQIRKMMSLAMLACRTGSPPSLIPQTFGSKRIHIPKAPPLGLLLEAPQFNMYNTRVSTKANGIQGDHDKIDWDLYQDEIRAFKLKYIYDRLRQDELDTNVFHKWIKQMDSSDPTILAFLNTSGTIPAEAEIGKNNKERREKEKQMEKDLGSDGEDEDVDEKKLRSGELDG